MKENLVQVYHPQQHLNMKYDVYVTSLLKEIKCWDGYHKEGMKTSGRTGKKVNNCVKNKKKKKK